MQDNNKIARAAPNTSESASTSSPRISLPRRGDEASPLEKRQQEIDEEEEEEEKEEKRREAKDGGSSTKRYWDGKFIVTNAVLFFLLIVSALAEYVVYPAIIAGQFGGSEISIGMLPLTFVLDYRRCFGFQGCTAVHGVPALDFFQIFAVAIVLVNASRLFERRRRE